MTQEYQLQNTMTATAQEAGYNHRANAAVNGANDQSLASAAAKFAAAAAADRSCMREGVEKHIVKDQARYMRYEV